MNMSYRDELFDALTSVGISGRLRSRIMAEIEDHLACDPEADLGQPRSLAAQFADELGSSRARRAGLTSFCALAVAGTAFAIAFLTAPSRAFASPPPHTSWLAYVAAVSVLLAPQVAFVAGGLALLRTLRRGRARVIAGAEADVIRRRSAVGVLAGMASLAGLGLLAIELRHHLPGWWVALAEVTALVGLAALAAAVPSLMRSVNMRPLTAGAAGDVFDDLGRWAPGVLRGRPWRFAVTVAGGIVVAFALSGLISSDVYDTTLVGLTDALACLLGFATLGRYLRLWTPEPGRRSPVASMP